MKFIRYFLQVFLISCSAHGYGQPITIIPEPVQLISGEGNFTFSGSTQISAPIQHPEISRIVDYFIKKLNTATGYSLKIRQKGVGDIQFQLNEQADNRIGQEGYTVTATPQNVIIKANTPAGIFYGIQTLLQLFPKEIESKTQVQNILWQIPSVTIVDFPRFAWRGIMLDVSRHFFPAEYIKIYIDQLARYKFNRFQWHLTDDQGWRIEIKSHPKLTQVGAWRVPRTGTFGTHEPPTPNEKPTDGGFYTQEEIGDIVQYAKERFIEILPEIDVPGHSMAAIAAYPELSVSKDQNITVNPGSKFSTWHGNGKFTMHIDNSLNPTDENVYKFLEDVFTEIAALFPFEYIHIGGDECYKGYWERDAAVQSFMKKNGLKTSNELQSYFTKRLCAILNKKNKKAIGWDEILEGGLAPGAAVMSWRGTKGGIEASHRKHNVVMSPAPLYYLDMMQGEPSIEPPVYSSARLKDTYAFDIISPDIDSTYVLGGQGNLWTEQIPTTLHVEYMTYPRAFAIAESLWSPKSKKNWDTFIPKVENHLMRFDQAQINYATSMYDPIITVKRNKDKNLVIELSTEMKGLELHYSVDNTIPNQYFQRYQQPIVMPDGADMFRVIAYQNGKPRGRLISLKTEELSKRVKQ
jgi:hexosaminidase